MKSKIITSTTIVAILFAFSISSCKKESSQENVTSKTVKTFDKSIAIKNIDNFGAFLTKKKSQKTDNVKVNDIQNPSDYLGLEFMNENYGDPGVTAYYVPQPIMNQNYNPTFATTPQDFNGSNPQMLSQKVSDDLSAFCDVSNITSALNTSPAVQESINGISATLKDIANTEMNNYIYGNVDTTNFNEDDYYNLVKSKATLAINNYMYNIGTSISLTSNEQVNILAASTYAIQLVNTVDFRPSLLDQGINNLSVQSINGSTIKVSGFFSSIIKVVTKVAKVIAATIVTAVVIIASAAVGAVLGSIFTTIDPSGADNNEFAGFSALGGAIYGFDQMYYKTSLWKWAGVR